MSSPKVEDDKRWTAARRPEVVLLFREERMCLKCVETMELASQRCMLGVIVS